MVHDWYTDGFVPAMVTSGAGAEVSVRLGVRWKKVENPLVMLANLMGRKNAVR